MNQSYGEHKMLILHIILAFCVMVVLLEFSGVFLSAMKQPSVAISPQSQKTTDFSGVEQLLQKLEQNSEKIKSVLQ